VSRHSGLKKATAPHAGHEIHVVLDNPSTPNGSSWLNQIEI
jgi:hypothetical protein